MRLLAQRSVLIDLEAERGAIDHTSSAREAIPSPAARRWEQPRFLSSNKDWLGLAHVQLVGLCPSS